MIVVKGGRYAYLPVLGVRSRTGNLSSSYKIYAKEPLGGSSVVHVVRASAGYAEMHLGELSRGVPVHHTPPISQALRLVLDPSQLRTGKSINLLTRNGYPSKLADTLQLICAIQC